MYQGAGRPHPGSKVTREPSNITTTEWHGSLRVHGLLFSPGDLYLYKRKYAFSIKRYLHGLDDEYEWGVNSQQCGCGVRSSLLPPYSWAPIPSMAICILMLKLMPRYLVNRTFRGSSSKTGVRPIWLFWLLLRLFLKAYQHSRRTQQCVRNSVLWHYIVCNYPMSTLIPVVFRSRTMSPDELVYLGVLVASIPVGFLFRYLSECLRTKPCQRSPLFFAELLKNTE